MNFNQKIEGLLTVVLREYPRVFLVDLKVSADKSIKVILDGDEEVNIKDCINISRAIEVALDRDEEDFSLEVASAGVGSPLKLARQYYKNLGRKMEVISTNGLKFEGELIHVKEDSIALQWKQREPKPIGKGKVTVTKNKTLMFDEISQTKVMTKF
jgi:ribosome maturation factor RimP|tara:strand:+ start:618 stop:1085 length:468 start_codon:yes stop_codon:yes gene_type:complete